MNTAMAQSCILLPDKPGQEQLWIIATERQLTGAIKKKAEWMDSLLVGTRQVSMSLYKEQGGDEFYTLNIVSHATLFVKGSFTVTDLN